MGSCGFRNGIRGTPSVPSRFDGKLPHLCCRSHTPMTRRNDRYMYLLREHGETLGLDNVNPSAYLHDQRLVELQHLAEKVANEKKVYVDFHAKERSQRLAKILPSVHAHVVEHLRQWESDAKDLLQRRHTVHRTIPMLASFGGLDHFGMRRESSSAHDASPAVGVVRAVGGGGPIMASAGEEDVQGGESSRLMLPTYRKEIPADGSSSSSNGGSGSGRDGGGRERGVTPTSAATPSLHVPTIWHPAVAAALSTSPMTHDPGHPVASLVLQQGSQGTASIAEEPPARGSKLQQQLPSLSVGSLLPRLSTTTPATTTTGMPLGNPAAITASPTSDTNAPQTPFVFTSQALITLMANCLPHVDTDFELPLTVSSSGGGGGSSSSSTGGNSADGGGTHLTFTFHAPLLRPMAASGWNQLYFEHTILQSMLTPSTSSATLPAPFPRSDATVGYGGGGGGGVSSSTPTNIAGATAGATAGASGATGAAGAAGAARATTSVWSVGPHSKPLKLTIVSNEQVGVTVSGSDSDSGFGSGSAPTTAVTTAPAVVTPYVCAVKLEYQPGGGFEQLSGYEEALLQTKAFIHAGATVLLARVDPIGAAGASPALVRLESTAFGAAVHEGGLAGVLKVYPEQMVAKSLHSALLELQTVTDQGTYVLAHRKGEKHMVLYKAAANQEDPKASYTVAKSRLKMPSLLEPMVSAPDAPEVDEAECKIAGPWRDHGPEIIPLMFPPGPSRKYDERFCYKYADDGACTVKDCVFPHLTEKESGFLVVKRVPGAAKRKREVEAAAAAAAAEMDRVTAAVAVEHCCRESSVTAAARQIESLHGAPHIRRNRAPAVRA